MGLKYVNNDACYPSLIVGGQIMDAILSGNMTPIIWLSLSHRPEEDAVLPTISGLSGVH